MHAVSLLMLREMEGLDTTQWGSLPSNTHLYILTFFKKKNIIWRWWRPIGGRTSVIDSSECRYSDCRPLWCSFFFFKEMFLPVALPAAREKRFGSLADAAGFFLLLCPRVSSGAASAAPNKNRKSLTFLAFRFFLFMCVCSSGRHQNFLPSDERDGSHWNGKEGGVFLHRPGNPPQHSLSTSRRWNIQLVRCSAIAFHEVCCLRLLELSCLLVDDFGKVWKKTTKCSAISPCSSGDERASCPDGTLFRLRAV